VLATMGGRYGGWALLVQNGKPEFAYAYSNQPEHKYGVTGRFVQNRTLSLWGRNAARTSRSGRNPASGPAPDHT
jgi:hypothetical protein